MARRHAIIAEENNGWMSSPRLGLAFRLIRHRTPVSTWHYVLEHREA